MPEALLHVHLARLLFAAGCSLVLGLLFAAWPALRPFGIMTAAWGAIDAGIVLASHGSGPPSLSTLVPFVALNEGLNVGYVGVGLAMASLAGTRRTVKGFGIAIVVQGAILLTLDGKLWLDLASLTLSGETEG